MRIVVDENELKNFLRRRFTSEDLYKLVGDVVKRIERHNHENGALDIGGIMATYYRPLIEIKFPDIDYFSEEYIKLKLGIK
jgi:hypothetical protein